jgi:DNA polymerase-3 subunit epsilon
MREIVLDTETTGFDPATGHRVVEIGCVELINHVRTGEHFHTYLNPERDMPEEAFNVHGLSADFLADKPLFSDRVQDFCDFIGESRLIIHNADFDMKFLNWELQALGRPLLPRDRALDTVAMARKRFPGSPASLDALCRRFGIDNSNREKHGALLDAELLADVYLELIGGREPGLALASARQAAAVAGAQTALNRPARPPRPHAATEAERAAHGEFIAKLTDALWLKA